MICALSRQALAHGATEEALALAELALSSPENLGEAKHLLAENGYDPHYGARPLKRVIQRLVQDPLAMRILEGDFPEGSKVLVDARVSGDALEFRPAP